ncbi:MAG: c-type cytochrome [Thermoflexales bacterium]
MGLPGAMPQAAMGRAIGAFSRLAVVAASLALCACTAGSPPAGDPADGERLFLGQVAVKTSRGDVPPCARCHGTTPDGKSPLGPSLSGVADRAATRVRGQNAAAYLRESILNPDAVLVDNYQEGIMYRGYRDSLTDRQLDNLVAYLTTLKLP